MIWIFFLLLLAFATLTISRLSTGVLLLIALLPAYLFRAMIGPIPTTFLEGAILIVFLVWMMSQLRACALRATLMDLFSRHRHACIGAISLFFIATLSIFFAPSFSAALGVWKAFFLEPMLLAVVLFDLLHKKILAPKQIIQSLGVSALLVSAIAYLQWATGLGLPAPWDLERRATGLFEYPNALALFLEPIIVLSWFSIKDSANARERGGWIFLSLFATGAIALAQSEAALFALLFSGILFLLAHKTTRFFTLGTLIALAIAAWTIPFSRIYLTEKILFHDASQQVRLSQWKETIALLRDHPWTGAGLSGYPNALIPYHHDLRYERFQYPHQLFLNFWTELGLLGLFWLCAALGAFSIVVRKNLSWAIHSPYALLWLTVIVHGLVDVPYFKNDLAALMWICAILTTVSLSDAKKHV